MCKVLSINKQSLPVDSNPVSMPALHYNKALIAFPEGSAEKFALQLARKLSLNLCHLECVAASDCDFEKQEIQIDKVGIIPMGDNAAWLKNELEKRGLVGEALLVQTNVKTLPIALKMALNDVGFSEYQDPYNAFRLVQYIG